MTKMEKTAKPEVPKDMPMCERIKLLNSLQNLVEGSEPAKQLPRVLIRSSGCQCGKNKNNLQSEHYCNMQLVRAANKTPPQTFDIEQIMREEKESSKPKENKDPPANAEKTKDCKAPDESKDKNLEANDSDDKKNIITVRRICKVYDDKDPAEIKALIKEGKLPPENEEVCTKDPKTGTFTCYTVQPGGRIITQITEAQPLPEERKVVPHPSLPIPKPSTNFELRGSKLLVGCYCLKRNGMQHDCQRRECQGKRECLKFPSPVCQPSGLAPPIIKISPIKTSLEPECGPKRKLQITKTEMEKRKVLLNYARAQYYQWPPSPKVPCKLHKKNVYYIRPLQKIADAQTDKELLDQYIKSLNLTEDNPTEKEGTKTKGILKEETTNKIEKDAAKDKTEETNPKTKIEETLKKLEKDLNMKQ